MQIEAEKLFIWCETPYKNLAILVAGIYFATMQVDIANRYVLIFLLQITQDLPTLSRYDTDVLINTTDEHFI